MSNETENKKMSSLVLCTITGGEVVNFFPRKNGKDGFCGKILVRSKDNADMIGYISSKALPLGPLKFPVKIFADFCMVQDK